MVLTLAGYDTTWADLRALAELEEHSKIRCKHDTQTHPSGRRCGWLWRPWAGRSRGRPSPASRDRAVDASTDGDGMPDGWEITNFLDATNGGDDVTDPDNDSLINLQEFLNGTIPHNNDTDWDGMPDGWEVQYPFKV